MANSEFRIRRLLIRRFAVAVLVTTVAWWLFHDTYVRHTGPAHRLASTSLDGHRLTESSHDRSGPIRIRFGHFGTYQDYTLWRDIIDSFQRDNPGTRVSQEYVVGLAGAYDTKMRQQVLSGTLPDVALIQLGPFTELAEQFADLTDLVENPLDQRPPLSALLDGGALSAFRSRGVLRGAPVSGGNLLIFGNKTCFDKAARFHGKPVPLPRNDWTMEDFRIAAELLTCDFDGDGRIDQFGFWLPRWIYYLPFIWSFGAELTDQAVGQWRLTGTRAERAFAFYRDLALDHRVCPRDDEVPQLFQDVGFLTGRVALCVNGPWFMPFLAKTRLASSYFVAPIPSGPGGRVTRITWDGVVMPRNLPPGRRARATRFIRFLLSKPVQDRIAATGRALPARQDSISVFLGSSSGAKGEAFAAALSYSRLQPRLPRFGEVDRAINEHIRQLVDPSFELTPAAMLENLARDSRVVEAFAGREVGSR